MVTYREIESLEWVENVPEGFENTITITDEEGCRDSTDDNLIRLLNDFSRIGWEVVNFTDTFNYLGADNDRTLQRRKCYLLRKSK